MCSAACMWMVWWHASRARSGAALGDGENVQPGLGEAQYKGAWTRNVGRSFTSVASDKSGTESSVWTERYA